MTALDISRPLVTFASAILTFGLYAQVWKIFRTQSAEDFSPILLGSLLLNEGCWLFYGVTLWEWPVMLVAALNIPAVVLGIIGYWKYGRDVNFKSREGQDSVT